MIRLVGRKRHRSPLLQRRGTLTLGSRREHAGRTESVDFVECLYVNGEERQGRVLGIRLLTRSAPAFDVKACGDPTDCIDVECEAQGHPSQVTRVDEFVQFSVETVRQSYAPTPERYGEQGSDARFFDERSAARAEYRRRIQSLRVGSQRFDLCPSCLFVVPIEDASSPCNECQASDF